MLTGRIARAHFSPTEGAAQSLRREGVDPTRVVVTGNTVIDALLSVRGRVAGVRAGEYEGLLGARLAGLLDRGETGPLVLVTGHRRENFGQGFLDLCQALKRLAASHTDWTIVFPVHLNPEVQRPVHGLLGDVANIHLIQPLEYRPFVWLMDRATVILTDSGGIQEEGPSLRVPVLVTRDVTERPEAVAAGTVALVGTDPERIVSGIEAAVGDPEVRARMTTGDNPYGDGRAAERIVDFIATNDVWRRDWCM
jgi:UDP-N-acetylglucosamine 2-epimerase (non-hydrolysing)